MRNRITALHLGSGIWRFTCEAHDPAWTVTSLTGPRQATDAMREHVNEAHPGQRFTLRRESNFSGNKTVSYTGASPIIEPGTPEGDSR